MMKTSVLHSVPQRVGVDAANEDLWHESFSPRNSDLPLDYFASQRELSSKHWAYLVVGVLLVGTVAWVIW